MVFNPNFNITPDLTKALMEIEGIKEVIKCLSITPTIIKTLRESARLKYLKANTSLLNEHEAKIMQNLPQTT